MKKILGLVLYAGVMFGVTAGLGMFMLKKSSTHSTAANEEETESESEHGLDSEPGHPADSSSEHDTAQEYQTAEHHSGASHATGSAVDQSHSSSHSDAHDERLPVAVRCSL